MLFNPEGRRHGNDRRLNLLQGVIERKCTPFGVYISTSLAFYAYSTLIRWRNVVQGVHFIVVPNNAAVAGCPSAFRLSMSINLPCTVKR